jgi:branched-chain amino acid transport system substrate-binding protein
LESRLLGADFAYSPTTSDRGPGLSTMKRNVSTHMPPSVLRSLERLGADIRIARLKRNLTAAQLASALQIHRSTLSRVEAGDPMVALGIYAGVLHALGLGTPFADAADPRRDEHGLLLDLQRLPQRARADRRQPLRSPMLRRPAAPDRTLRIGVLGVMSGPAAPWGMVNRHCAEITAEMYNDAGGIDIGGERFKIEVCCFDDVLSALRAAEGARHLTETEGVRYIIGPNVEQTMSAVLPIVERNRAMVFPYSFTRSLYRPPRGNAVLCQVAGYQAIPSIYRHLMRKQGVETISLVAPATAEGLRQRQDASRIATSLGMRVVCESATYRVGADDLESAVEPAVARRPDILALPNVAPLDASRLIGRARDLGFRGLITTESAQDIEHLISTLGADADGIVMVGGASLPETRSRRMEDFMQRFVRRVGAWNDEAGTKAYALEFVLGTLQVAGKAALDDIGPFKAAIPHFAIDNPLARTRASMAYVGAGEFERKRQIGIPLVVNTIRKGRLETLFTQQPEEFLL